MAADEESVEAVRDPHDSRKMLRNSKYEWLWIDDLEVSPAAQRQFNPHRAAEIASNFDPDSLGLITVSVRDGKKRIVDGQHRVGAVRIFFGCNTKVPCEVFYGMTEAEEAELFLSRDARVAITSYDKFRIGLTAGRPDELAIDAIVRMRGLRVSKGGAWDSIGSVSALRKVFTAYGGDILDRTLMVLAAAFEGDDVAFSSDVINGMGKVIARYSGKLDDEHSILKLARLKGGASVLQRMAEGYRRKMDRTQIDCTAGAIVDVLNDGEGPRARHRVESWWK